MKILQLTNKVPWPPKDGGAIATLNLSKGFSMLGHQVTLLSMNTLKHHVNIEDIPEELNQSINFNLVDVPAKITTCGMLSNLLFSQLPYNASRFINENFSRKLTEVLQNNQFDVIQLEGLYLCPYIALIRRYSNALISYRAHNVEFEIWQRTTSISKGFRKVYLNILSKRIKKFELSFLNEYDVLIPITQRDGAALNELGNTQALHTSQAGIDLVHVAHPSAKIEYPSLFHIGALDWGPNQEGLIWFIEQCWPTIRTKYPNINFYIAGRNAPEWLEKRFNSKGICYLGEIDDAYQFMGSKAIMVVPIRSGSGMRVKIIEGMAHGKAIVSTSIGAEGIAVTHNKHMLVANDSESFIDEISRLINNREFFDSICKNSVDFIRKNFDNLAITDALIDFYKKHIHE